MKKLLLLLPLLWAACASPFVGFATFDGVGSVRTDGIALVAFGDIVGEAGMFAKGSNLPVTLPFVVDEGQVYLYNYDLGINRHQALTEPLPLWVKPLIPSGHQVALEEMLGVQLYFGDIEP